MINTTRAVKLYQAISDGNEDRVFDLWHASSIAMCPLAHYLKRLGTPEIEKPTAAKILRWQAGHNLEAAIRPYIEAVYGGLTSNERLTSVKLQLTGEFDNLVLADNRLVEIKSVSDFAFIQRDNQISLKEANGELNRYGKPTYDPRKTPYLSHELQNHAYALLLEEQSKKVEHIDYVYISLNGRLVVYSTKIQDKLLTEVKNRLETLNEAWESKQPPKCLCNPEHELWDSMTRWCPYKQENKCCDL